MRGKITVEGPFGWFLHLKQTYKFIDVSKRHSVSKQKSMKVVLPLEGRQLSDKPNGVTSQKGLSLKKL
jgi:hypothetical protein